MIMRNNYLLHRLALPAIFVLVTVYMAIINYPTLPAKIPTHFGPSGAPDSWGNLSFSGFFSLPFLQVVLYALLAGLTLVFSRRRDIRDIINLPGKDKLSGEQLEKIRSIMIDGMSLLNLLTCTMLFYIQLGTIKIVRDQWSSLGPVVWIFTLSIVGTSAWMLYRIFIVRKQS